MKKYEKYKDPVNYKLKDEDLQGEEDFKHFLNNLTDVPSSIPLHNVSIDEAGITNQQIIINLKDILNKESIVPVLCNLSVAVHLKENRGIHMSRIEDVLFEISNTVYDSLEIFAETLAVLVREKQGSSRSIVKVKAVYFHTKLTKSTKKISRDKLYLYAHVVSTHDSVKTQIGMTVYNMTACPCTKTYTKFSIVPQLLNLSLDKVTIQKIVDLMHPGSHTQRGLSTILIHKTSDVITYRTLYEILDRSCHLIYELLKRPDEHDLVISALAKPQFTEDVAREIAKNLVEEFTCIPEDTKLYIKSLLLDSIHIHDVYTKILKTVGEIKEELA